MFNKKPVPQTLEQEHHDLVSDLIDLTKLLGQARQADILEKSDASRKKVEYYQRAIDACQVRLIKLGEKINKRDAAQ